MRHDTALAGASAAWTTTIHSEAASSERPTGKTRQSNCGVLSVIFLSVD
jgi:hypothetical protein